MLTTFNEVDMTGVMAVRERHKQTFKERFGVQIPAESGASPLFVFTDETVNRLYGDRFMSCLERLGYQAHRIVTPDGEGAKSMESFNRLVEEVLSLGIDVAQGILQEHEGRPLPRQQLAHRLVAHTEPLAAQIGDQAVDASMFLLRQSQTANETDQRRAMGIGRRDADDRLIERRLLHGEVVQER